MRASRTSFHSQRVRMGIFFFVHSCRQSFRIYSEPAKEYKYVCERSRTLDPGVPIGLLLRYTILCVSPNLQLDFRAVSFNGEAHLRTKSQRTQNAGIKIKYNTEDTKIWVINSARNRAIENKTDRENLWTCFLPHFVVEYRYIMPISSVTAWFFSK